MDIAVDPVAADTIYVASATGGVWKSTDKGARFTSTGPPATRRRWGRSPPTSTECCSREPAKPSRAAADHLRRSGIYRSSDGGATWQDVGLTYSGAIGRLAVDPTEPNTSFAAAAGDLYNHGGERGVYESTDGGSNWTRVLAGDNDTTGAVDLAIDPTNPNRVYAAMWDHLRQPDLRTYGGVGSGVYRSMDGGTLATARGRTACRVNDIGRIGVALARRPAAPVRHHHSNRWDVQGLYRSENGGDTWTKLPTDAALSSAQSTYGWWFGRLWVDPVNKAHVFGAGVYLCESKNSGASFSPAFSPHPDHHAMIWDSKVPNRVYLGNDGGVYRSDINGRTISGSRELASHSRSSTAWTSANRTIDGWSGAVRTTALIALSLGDGTPTLEVTVRRRS